MGTVVTRAELPSGIVAFVFSDIEGSTRLFRRLGEGWVDVLERHNDLLRRAWGAHGGAEIKSEGDGFFVAFQDANDALAACIEAQHLLAEASWPDGIELRVRMGVHAGLAYPRGHDYVALAVHQAARVASAAHGGQVLLSGAAAELLDARHEAMLVPLGAYRVRDFDEPVQLFRAVAEGLEDRLVPVRAIPAERHNLVRPPTSFVGRAGQVGDIAGLLAPGRLLTVVGPGGVGKTRLAVELGLRVAPDWPDGVWFVDLSSIDDPALIPEAIATAIGTGVRAHADTWQSVVEHLHRCQALLILDTSEHLSDGVVRLTSDLLASCPDVAVLTTSRTPLGAPGEQLFRLGPLATATAEGPSPATELFVERARTVEPGFEPDDRQRADIEAICRRLDGLPLAIELAAARVGVLSPHEILQELEDPFGLLRSRDRTIPERQRTLDGLIAWSERLLAPDERTLLHRLGVFTGSFGLAEATAIGGDPIHADDVPDLVWSLAESSLITPARGAGATRYRLLDSVQAYARRELDAEGSLTVTAERLGRWYVERHFQDGRFQRDRLGDFRISLDNVRGTIAVLTERAPEVAQWLASGIGEYHVLLTTFRAGAEEVADLVTRLPAQTKAGVYLLTVYADLLLWEGEETLAAQVLTRAEELRERVGSPSGSTDWSIAYDRADLLRRGGDPKGAIERAQQALDEPGDAGRSRMLNLLGITYYELGDMDAAYGCFVEGLEVDRRVRHDQNVAIAHANIAETALVVGRRDEAAEHALACLRASRELGMSVTLGMSMATAAHLIADTDLATAVELAARTQRIFELDGFTPAADEQGPTIEALFERATAELGPDGFAEAKERGRATPLPEGIERAAEVLEGLVAARDGVASA